MNEQRANTRKPNVKLSRNKKEFMETAIAAVFSETTKYAKPKTAFIARLLERDVDRATINRLNRVLDANPQKTG